MTEKMKNLEDLLHHELRDLYSAEKQIASALPKMVEKASDERLRKALSNHLEETQNQKERLEKVAEKLGIDIEGMTCKAMQGLIREGEDMLHEDASPEVRDAGLIAAAQRVEHYEIAGYGTVCRYAEQLGKTEVKRILGETLNEEKNADSKLTEVAESYVNTAAEA